MHTWRLFSEIQYYAWGSKNQQAYIPRLLGIPIEPDMPYAELWLGDNPKAPSTVVGHGQRGYMLKEKLTLDKLIAQDPLKYLGPKCAEQFGPHLPFLAKILSIGDSLSIQVHPNLEQAAHLHARSPEHYPDSNHKPEMAIAIDRVTALAGFLPPEQMRDTLTQYPEIASMVTTTILAELLHPNTGATTAFMDFFRELCANAQSESNRYVHAVRTLDERLREACLTRKLTPHEQLFLYLKQRYGAADPGLFLMFLLNFVELKSGDALIIPAGMPHAYLQGNLFECMACSDNVVRAGLTPKHKDLNALSEIVVPKLALPTIHRPHSTRTHVEYPVFTPEFAVERVLLEESAGMYVFQPDSPYLIFFVEGFADISYTSESGEKIQEDYKQSHCVFVPAGAPPIEIRAKGDCLFFICKVP